jgi:hypothetical protein
MGRDITSAMNLLVNKLDQVSSTAVPIGEFLIKKAIFGTALFALAIEFLIFWQLFHPMELLIASPTDEPRPVAARVGLLRRF